MPSLLNPYQGLTRGRWLRGNLHTHTTQSDGSRSPQETIDDYAKRGYGFLMFSDHDVFTSQASYAKWNDRGMVLIPGNEIAGGPHLLHVDAERLVPSRPSRQEIINDIVGACTETGHGFAVINRPDWQDQFDHCTIEQLREWTGYLGIEIYNGVIARLDGSPYALNKWDMLLSEGRRVWGFANDDCHHAPDAELGWNVAWVKDRTVNGVVEALRAGRFYCSTGVTINSIRVSGLTVRIETENARRIAAVQNCGKRFAVVDSKVIEAQIPPSARYVRFECYGDGERAAWTQPFFLEAGTEETPPGLRFVAEWKVTDLLEEIDLRKAKPPRPGSFRGTIVRSQSARDPIPGFADVRGQIQGRAGVMYLSTAIPSDSDCRGVVRLGYDGPVCAWLNGREIFRGPGANPAIADRVAVYAPFKRGSNALVVALDSNGGKAWGIFGRVELNV